MADVFISYSRRDTEFVRTLYDALDASTYETWIDWQGIAPTTEWWKEIEAGIEAADNFLFVISPDSVGSKYCLLEIDHAIKQNKRIIPVLRRSADMPKAISHIQRVSFLEDAPFEPAFAKLVDAINTDQGHKKTHTRLQVRAIEWDQVNQDGSLLLRGSDLEKAEQWLLQAAGKEPRPTELQGEYIAASRKSSTGRQRTLVVTLGSLLALAFFGGGVGYWQFGRASRALADSEQARTAEIEQREIAEARQQEAETERGRAEEALKEAEKQRQLAELKQQEAEEALLQAEAAQQAETQQRQVADQALVRAEEGEAEAQKQTAIAQEQTEVAQRQTVLAQESEAAAVDARQEAEIEKLNAELRADALTVENLMAADLNFKAWLQGLELGQKIRSIEGQALAAHSSTPISYTKQNPKSVIAPKPQLSSDIRPEVKLQAAAVLREIYNYPGYLHRNTLEGHSDWVRSVSFSPDGTTLASASDDGTVKLWNFDLDDLIAKSCAWLH